MASIVTSNWNHDLLLRLGIHKAVDDLVHRCGFCGLTAEFERVELQSGNESRGTCCWPDRGSREVCVEQHDAGPFPGCCEDPLVADPRQVMHIQEVVSQWFYSM